jgi:hypothetical protein
VANTNPFLLTLVDIQAPGGTKRFATVQSFYGGVEWEERVLGDVRVAQRALTQTGGAGNGQCTIAIDNTDGVLNAWLDPAASDDPRGAILRVYETTEEDPHGTATLVYDGQVSRVSQTASSDGHRTVTVEATAVDAGDAAALIPPAITTTTFGVTAAELVEEAIGKPVPIVIGGTREHFPAIAIKNSPTNEQYDWAICYLAADAHCRATVNTLYRIADDNKLRVVPPSAFSQLRTTYSGVLVARFADARYIQTQLYADAECSEYDTDQTGVVAHWLFRGSTLDEKKKARLHGSGVVGLWEFANNLNDSSGNAYTLVALAGSESPVVYGAEDGIATQALHNQFLPVAAGRFEVGGGATTSTFDVGLATSFRVEIRAAAETRDAYKALTGPVVAKWGNGSAIGYEVGFLDGQPYFWVQGATGAESLAIYGTTRCDDGSYHEIVASLDRATDRMELWVDGVREASRGVAVLGSISNTNTKLYVATNRASQNFAGLLGAVAWYNSAAGEELAYVLGQSGQSKSAVSQATGYLRYGDDADLDVTGTDELSVMTWINRATNPGTTEIVVGKYTGSTGWKIELLTNGTVRGTAGDGTTTKTVTGAADICDGAWHQVWFQVDRGGNVELYVDGISVATTATSGLGSCANAANLEMRLVGSMDELAIRKSTSAALTAATIRAQYFTAKGNPARWVRRIINNATYGLNKTVDATTFDAAEDELQARGIYFGGAVTEEQSANELLSKLAVYGLTVKREGGTYKASFGWQQTAGSAWAFGWKDGGLNNCMEVSGLTRASASEVPSAISVRYKRALNPERPNAPYLLRTFARTVLAGTGRPLLVIDGDFVRRWEVADRIGAFRALWLAKDRRCRIAATTENRAAVPGDRATLTAPDLGLTTSTTWMIESVERVGGATIEYDLREAPADPTTYAAGTAIPDTILSDGYPDYRWTHPPAPEQISVIGQVAIAIATRVGIQWTNPAGDVADAVLTGVRIYWRYQDATSPNSNEWATVDLKAEPGKAQAWYTIFEPGRTVDIALFSVSIYGQEGGPGLWTDGSTTYELAVAEDYVTTTGGEAGLEYRVGLLEAGGAGGGYVPRILGSNTALPTEPDLTGGNEVIILVQQGFRWRVASAPTAQQFTLGGAGNQTITYGSPAPAAGATAIALYRDA